MGSVGHVILWQKTKKKHKKGKNWKNKNFYNATRSIELIELLLKTKGFFCITQKKMRILIKQCKPQFDRNKVNIVVLFKY